jgi:FhuF 2Fe-2S C-terminal domain
VTTDPTTAQPVNADPTLVRGALADAAAFGPYFTSHDRGVSRTLTSRDWYAKDRLLAALHATGERIGSSEVRVAASTLQYGMAARFWSIGLGAWVCGDVIPTFDHLRYAVSDTGAEPVLLEPKGWNCQGLPPSDVATVLTRTVVDALAGLHGALRAVGPVADGLLWGNAASALIGAVRVVSTGAAARPLTALADAVLSSPPLTHRLARTPEGSWIRRSCCLWYRTSEADTCGDCPLTVSAAVRLRTRRGR